MLDILDKQVKPKWLFAVDPRKTGIYFISKEVVFCCNVSNVRRKNPAGRFLKGIQMVAVKCESAKIGLCYKVFNWIMSSSVRNFVEAIPSS